MPKSIPKKAYAAPTEPPKSISMVSIGMVRSPHKERFGTPHQAVLQADAGDRSEERARIELDLRVVQKEVLRDLEGFDYVWVLAYLHLNHGWKPLVAPPRDRDNKHGLFSTRAPHRPNPIGLSAARIVRVYDHVVEVERLDLLDGTPVLDLKPYVPYADAFPEAKAGWLDRLPVPHVPGR